MNGMLKYDLLEFRFSCKWYKFIFPFQSLKRATWSAFFVFAVVLAAQYLISDPAAARTSMIGGAGGVFGVLYITLPMKILIKSDWPEIVASNVENKILSMGFFLDNCAGGVSNYAHKGPKLFRTDENTVKIWRNREFITIIGPQYVIRRVKKEVLSA